ncbi:MAG TPA: glycosyltransferase family 2 protein [Flavitalea sp.]|nr:glycosyltransferase family 2 protein [Flavitalea sp.]
MSYFISVIIVNYKTPKLLLGCLRSIFGHQGDLPLEIIVVDNASGDNSRELIGDAYPSVKWIQMPYNAGFARANNEGIRQSASEIVLLLNSDTLNINNNIKDCAELFVRSEYVACGVQLLNEDGTPQISGNYFMKGGLNNLLPLPYVGPVLKGLGMLFSVKKPNIPDTNEPVEVDWINGAFLMVKKTAIDRVGLMDEDFFLYAEEAEWCSRLRKAGKLVIYGQYKIFHLQGETANTAFKSSGRGYYNLYDRKGLQIMLSNFVRIRKQFGIGWFLFHLFAYSFIAPLAFAASLFKIIFSFTWDKQEFSRMLGFLRNILTIWRYTPIILRGTPFFYKIL